MLAGVLLACAPPPKTEDTPPDDGPEPFPWTDTELKRIGKLWPISEPLPDTTNAVADDPQAARLGQYLFFDTRLSGSGEHSCATCHDPDHGFADPARLSEAAGTPGAQGREPARPAGPLPIEG